MTSLDTRHFLSRFCLGLVDITQWYTQFLTFDRLVVNCVLKKIQCAISKRNNFRLFHNSSVVFDHKTSLNPLFFLLKCLFQSHESQQHMCARDIDFSSFYDFSTGFWICSDRDFSPFYDFSTGFWICSDRVVFLFFIYHDK